jgi:hypothetical protein
MEEEAMRHMLDLPDDESLEQIDARIKTTFTVLVKVARGLIDSNIRSVIVSGAAGCGRKRCRIKRLTADVLVLLCLCKQGARRCSLRLRSTSGIVGSKLARDWCTRATGTGRTMLQWIVKSKR